MTLQINITLPVPQDEISAKVKELLEEIKTRKAEIEIIRQTIKTVQGCCSHPRARSGMDSRDGNWFYCPVCEKNT